MWITAPHHIIFASNSGDLPMQLSDKNGLFIRRNTHMRSLVIEYTRSENGGDILAALTLKNQATQRFNLPVFNVSAEGISVKLPALLSGMFELSIQDGQQRFSKWIALQ